MAESSQELGSGQLVLFNRPTPVEVIMLDDREVQVVGGSEEEKKAPSSELNVLPDGLEKAASKAEVAKELEAKGAEQEAESCREEAREIVQKQLGGLDGFDR